MRREASTAGQTRPVAIDRDAIRIEETCRGGARLEQQRPTFEDEAVQALSEHLGGPGHLDLFERDHPVHLPPPPEDPAKQEKEAEDKQGRQQDGQSDHPTSPGCVTRGDYEIERSLRPWLN